MRDAIAACHPALPPGRATGPAGLLATLMTVAVLLGLTVAPARSEVQIDITQGTVEPLPIAIADFFGASELESSTGGDIAEVVTANLQRSGLFRPIDSSAFIQTPDELRAGPRYADWRILNAQALVTGLVETQADGRLRVEFRLFDVIGEARMAGFAYSTEPENWRRIAHIISDAIYQRITGETGYFDSRIVYISESGPATQRVKRLAIMDQDGANHRYLTDGSVLVLTPQFSPSSQEITYLAYYNNRPRVYLFDIDTGRQELLGDFPGMTFAPRFSPDGNRVIFSMAEGGNTDIYTMDLRTKAVTQLTNDPAIDTSPSFSPDGSQIVFESDRGGRQQLYVMNSDGSGVSRISFGGGSYGAPVWSPRGDLIAFTKLEGGQFSVGVIRPDGTGERNLVSAYHVEGPTWAPNGRVISYFTETPSSQGATARLAAVDLTGSRQWMIPTPINGSDPAWSPLNN